MNPLQNQFRAAAGAAPAAPSAMSTPFDNMPEAVGNARYPRPAAGRYHLKVVNSGTTQTPGKSPFFFIDFEVVSATNGTPAGSVVHFDQCMSDKARATAFKRIKHALIAITGASSEAEFNAISGPAGNGKELVAAAGGWVQKDANGNEYPLNPLDSLEVLADVSFGGEVPRRNPEDAVDYYRDWVFTAVPTA